MNVDLAETAIVETATGRTDRRHLRAGAAFALQVFFPAGSRAPAPLYALYQAE